MEAQRAAGKQEQHLLRGDSRPSAGQPVQLRADMHRARAGVGNAGDALPQPFQERLFVHLSRCAGMPDCALRQVASLVSGPVVAGAAGSQSVDAVMRLLARPLPDARALDAAVSRLQALAPGSPLPDVDSQVESDLFDALGALFVVSRHAARARDAIRQAFGIGAYGQLAACLASIHVAHSWARTHPEPALPAEADTLLRRHPQLVEALHACVHPDEAAVSGTADAASGLDALERQLRLREEELSRVQRIGAIAGVDTDVADGLRGWRSPEYLHLHGLPPDMRFEDHAQWRERVHPDDRERTERALFDALEGDASHFEYDYRIIRPSDGAERWMHARLGIERDAAGKARRLVGAHIDVTDAKRTELALRESRAQQAFLLRLSDAVRAEAGLREIGRTVTHMLGGQLGVDHCCAAGLDLRRNRALSGAEFRKPHRPPILRALAHPDLLGLLRRFEGEPVVVADASNDAALSPAERAALASLGLAAFIVVPVRNRRRDAAWCMLVADTAARSWSQQDLDLVRATAERTWAAGERARAEEALRSSEQRLRQFGEASSDILWIRDARTLRFEFISPAYAEVYGVDRLPSEGDALHGWSRLVAPADRVSVLDNLLRVVRGEHVVQEFRILRPDTGEERWIRDTSFPLRDADGHVQRIGGIGQDITGQKRTGDRLHVLISELQHRTRNLIAVVRALADKTLQGYPSTDAFREVFRERLDALARVQGRLSRLEGDKVRFEELLQEELDAQAAFDGHAGRVVLEGPRGIRLRSGSVQTLALALHELTTNAVKYGALSAPQGRLHVAWQVRHEADGGVWLHVRWRESGVDMPAQAEPQASGYGRELIERALPFQLNARTSYRMARDGVDCSIAVPIHDVRT